MSLLQDAVAQGARLHRACALVGLSVRTYQRWMKAPEAEDGRRGPRTPPRHKLSAQEERAIIELVNRPTFRNLSPEQVVAKAADDGCYIASERSIRRVLARHKQGTYRERARPATHSKPRQLLARGPLQVLTWDITYLRHGTVRGGYFFLYLFVDIWSRRIVGAEVHEEQSAELAATLLKRICIEHDIVSDEMALHADNGGPMKGATMLATMHMLGIVKSFSRPGVSDDNPFVESLFRHLKYAPSYPSRGFPSLEAAREWVNRFVEWYNHHHLHSAIAFVTPYDRHHGHDIEMLEHRRKLYQEARNRNPRRWTGSVRSWKRPELVMLNPDRVVETRLAVTPSVA